MLLLLPFIAAVGRPFFTPVLLPLMMVLRPGADFISPTESLALTNRFATGLLPAEEVEEPSVAMSASAPAAAAVVAVAPSAGESSAMRRLERAAPKPAAATPCGPKPTAPLYVEKLLLICTRDSSGAAGGVVAIGDRLLMSAEEVVPVELL